MHDANFWRKYARMWIDAVELGLQLGMNFDDGSLKVRSESLEHFENELSTLSESKRDAVKKVLKKHTHCETKAFIGISRSRESCRPFKNLSF